MKKIIYTAIILFSCLLFKTADAQVVVGVGLNISSQPDWGPTGYTNASYYYMPDIDAYYDVNAHQYIYYQNNAWVHMGYLPNRYRNYDLYHGYKAVINDRDPWLRHEEYRNRYASFRGRRDQEIIRNSRDERYRNHWRANQRFRNENARENHLDRRAVNENRRDQRLNQRARRENQRSERQDRRSRKENQKDRQQN